jgi:peptidoglycan glycosyltransferase
VAAAKAKTALETAPGQPLRAHAFQDRYFPGSTFKVVTSGAGLRSGRVTPEKPVYPVTRVYVPPMTSIPVTNFGGEACGGALFTILAVSCNTSFAQMAAETLGPDFMISGAQAFGFNSAPPIDLPGAVKSIFPTNYEQNLPALAQAGFGQYEVQATPLEMALVAAGVANGGKIMAPTVMKEIRAADGSVVRRADRRVWRNALDANDAATLRAAMINVVQHGTAQGIAIPGVEVAGKTGTAQIVRNGNSTHAWMIAFAGPPGGEPTVAVAVFVKAVPGLGEQTGAAVAGPIAKAVLQAALAR